MIGITQHMVKRAVEYHGVEPKARDLPDEGFPVHLSQQQLLLLQLQTTKTTTATIITTTLLISINVWR